MAGPGPLATSKYSGFSCYLPLVYTGVSVLNLGATPATFPVYATGEALEVLSSDTNDTSAGTGARTIKLYVCDNDGTIDSTTVTLNGTTPVALADTSVARVLDMWCDSYGSGATNAGNIFVRKVSGVGRMGIAAGDKRAAPGYTTIPSGYIGLYRGFELCNSGTISGAPTIINYRIEADINPATGALDENKFIPIDWGTANLASGSIGTQPSAERGGKRIYLPEKCTIRTLAWTNLGSVAASGFVYVERHPKDLS